MTRSTRNQLFAIICLSVVMVALASVQARAQALPQDPTQFDETGFIQSATLDTACAYDATLCGGIIRINNHDIVVPSNTVLQMPATALSWQQVFALAPAPYGLAATKADGTVAPETGLAMADFPAPPHVYEAHVVGNRNGGKYIAGLMFLSQHSLQASQGFINYIDPNGDYFRVGGSLGSDSGQRVKINDPLGKFGPVSSTIDPRFTIDENNPTVRSGTGYPMCLQRNSTDALCPSANRPAPDANDEIVMPAVANVVVGGPDPQLMAPFQVGDFVDYSGILERDATGSYIAAYQVIGNVGLFTAPGDTVSYVAIDVGLMGVGGLTGAGLTEATARTRFEGFTTDPSRNIFLWGIDVDPCTGAQTPRSWGSIDVDQGAAAGGAVKGRWRFRPPNKVLTLPAAGAFAPATREVRAVRSNVDLSADNGTTITAVGSGNNGGLLAGLYQAPIFEFLFPENASPGTPIVPNNFENIPFLAQGSGPLDGFGGIGAIVGQLDLWPLGFTAQPTPVTCNIGSGPVANAGPDQTVPSNALVTLDGSLSTGAVSYAWVQTNVPVGGVPVVLTGADTVSPTFSAPTVAFGAAQTVLTFQLTVTDAGGRTSTDSVTIKVNPPSPDNVTIGLVEYRTTKSRLQVDAASSALPTGTAILTMQAYDASHNPMGGPINIPYVGAGLYSVVIVGVGQPTTVTVTSDHGGSATSGITRLRQ